MKTKTFHAMVHLGSKNWRHTAKCSWIEPLDKHGRRGSWRVLDWMIDYRASSVSHKPFTLLAPKQIEPLSDPLKEAMVRRSTHVERNMLFNKSVCCCISELDAHIHTLHLTSPPKAIPSYVSTIPYLICLHMSSSARYECTCNCIYTHIHDS